jgi:hypothetical protein
LRKIGRKTIVKKLLFSVLCLAFACAAPVIIAEEGAAAQENMKILMEKIKADKKLVVAANMDLSDSEAKGFWPLYDQYQADLQNINNRIAKVISEYAEAYNSKTLTDEQAKALMNESLSIEADEVAMKKKYAQKLGEVLPGKKAVRYLQTESKIRAVIRFEMAASIPFVE